MRTILHFAAAILGVLMSLHSYASDPPTFTYLHLYSDDAGESHIKSVTVSFNPLRREGGPQGYPLASGDGAMFLHLKSGAKEDWHTAPRTWFLVAVQGMSEVTTSDGEVRQLKPGMVMLMDDTKGKGHQTRAIGPEDHVALVVPVKEEVMK